jgi:hypothetical protein
VFAWASLSLQATNPISARANVIVFFISFALV